MYTALPLSDSGGGKNHILCLEHNKPRELYSRGSVPVSRNTLFLCSCSSSALLCNLLKLDRGHLNWQNTLFYWSVYPQTQEERYTFGALGAISLVCRTFCFIFQACSKHRVSTRGQNPHLKCSYNNLLGSCI